MLALKRKREAQGRAAAAAAGLSVSTLSPTEVGKKKRSAAETRIQNDLALVETEDARIEFPDPNNLLEFRLSVSPNMGLWSGDVFDFSFQVLPDYPYSPPHVRCETKIYHPNVSFYDGKVCLGIREWWRPVHDVSTVIYGIINIFYEPALDISVNQQAASLLKKNEENFRRIVTWMRHRSNDKKAPQQPVGHSILDALSPELLQIAADFLDEESLVKFFISCLGSVTHQYIYDNMARRLVKEKFAALQQLLRQPRPVGGSRTPPTISPAVIQFVDEYAANMVRQDEEQRMAGVLDVAGGNPAALQDDDADELEAIMDLQCIVQVIRCLSGRLAVLHYFRDTLQKNTRQDILWPVWCGKFQLEADRGRMAPSAVICTPIWYPSLIRRCKQVIECRAGCRLEREIDLMGRFERGSCFILATVTGMSSKDVTQLLDVGGRLQGARTDSVRRMAVVHPARARELLQRLTAILNTDDRRFSRANRMPLAQYERVVEQEGNGQLYCLWEDEVEEAKGGKMSHEIFTELIVELLTKKKSIQVFCNLPEH